MCGGLSITAALWVGRILHSTAVGTFNVTHCTSILLLSNTLKRAKHLSWASRGKGRDRGKKVERRATCLHVPLWSYQNATKHILFIRYFISCDFCQMSKILPSRKNSQTSTRTAAWTTRWRCLPHISLQGYSVRKSLKL